MSAYGWLIAEMDGKEFDTFEEYERAVSKTIEDKVEELYRAERWALQADPEVLSELGVSVKELED